MPTFEAKREVRFAVVMYGGVSLAIYINGVAQELLQMVQSTAGDPKPGSTQEIYREIAEQLGQSRFAIDVISGTSAGGINGVFLAKALALDTDLDAIKKLWVQEGDIGKLLNDKGSAMRGFELQNPPQSLLNSQRMYVKLLDAMTGMDSPNPPAESRLIPEELDLFVTATDLHGLVMPIQLADKKVYERKYRTSFHFEYRPCRDRNHFTARYTPFLAFAARSTSSFPVAFEPMTLGDIEPVLAQRGLQPDPEAWKVFYPDYSMGETKTRFDNRPLADGGYLDNKPFSFAVDQLMKRYPDLPVDRKLIYIEPVPDDPELDAKATRKLDAVENAWAALSSLPRQETICEDLQRILQRNVEIERLTKLMTALGDDDDHSESFQRLEGGDWLTADCHHLTETFGRSYVAYRHLRVSAVTDDIAAILYTHFGVDPASQQGRALRAILRQWRTQTYDPKPGTKGDRLNQFLYEFDLSFRMRRLNHLKRQADRICSGADPALHAQMKAFTDTLRACHRKLRRLRPEPGDTISLGTLDDLTGQLGRIADMNLPLSEEQAKRVLSVWDPEPLRKSLSARFATVFSEVRQETIAALEGIQDAAKKAELARAYYGFEAHDAVRFPILHNSAIGEPDVVEVIRISPEDATALIDERREQVHKLRGTALGNFGGFLDESWRKNDILWGRLDGSERIITALLPGPDNSERRAQLIKRAQEIIVREELGSEDHIRLALAAGPLTTRQIVDRHAASLKTRPEREDSAGWATRSTAIAGRMLEEIADQRHRSKRPFAWLTRVGRIGWALVEVLSPQSLGDLFLRHFLKLAWFAALLMLFAGLLIRGLRAPGLILVAWLAAIQIITWLIRDWLAGRRRALKLIGFLAGSILVALLVVGAIAAWAVAGAWIEHYFQFV